MNPAPGLGEAIASRRNPLFRRLAELDRDPAARQREGVYLVWGWRIVEEALREPARLERLVVGEKIARRPSARPLIRRALQASLAVTAVKENLLDEILPGAGDQGFLALVKSRPVSLDEMVGELPSPILLVADRIQDPGNLGALLRVGEATGIAGLIAMPGTVDPYHTRAARASSGSILRVPVARIGVPVEFGHWCRRRGIRVLAAVPAGGIPWFRADLSGGFALVAGNEGEGVSRDWLSVVDTRIALPLAGPVESLNVAAAAAAILYEAVRQRKASP